MNRLDSVLFSEEGQKALETSVPAAVASKGHVTVTATGTIDHMTSELPELNTIGHSDFVIDDVIIQVSFQMTDVNYIRKLGFLLSCKFVIAFYFWRLYREGYM